MLANRPIKRGLVSAFSSPWLPSFTGMDSKKDLSVGCFALGARRWLPSFHLVVRWRPRGFLGSQDVSVRFDAKSIQGLNAFTGGIAGGVFRNADRSANNDFLDSVVSDTVLCRGKTVGTFHFRESIFSACSRGGLDTSMTKPAPNCYTDDEQMNSAVDATAAWCSVAAWIDYMQLLVCDVVACCHNDSLCSDVHLNGTVAVRAMEYLFWISRIQTRSSESLESLPGKAVDFTSEQFPTATSQRRKSLDEMLFSTPSLVFDPHKDSGVAAACVPFSIIFDVPASTTDVCDSIGGQACSFDCASAGLRPDNGRYRQWYDSCRMDDCEWCVSLHKCMQAASMGPFTLPVCLSVSSVASVPMWLLRFTQVHCLFAPVALLYDPGRKTDFLKQQLNSLASSVSFCFAKQIMQTHIDSMPDTLTGQIPGDCSQKMLDEEQVTNGQRAGDRSTVANDSGTKKKPKIVMATFNGNSWAGLKAFLRDSEANIVLGQEHRISGPAIIEARLWARKNGWSSF